MYVYRDDGWFKTRPTRDANCIRKLVERPPCARTPSLSETGNLIQIVTLLIETYKTFLKMFCFGFRISTKLASQSFFSTIRVLIVDK